MIHMTAVVAMAENRVIGDGKGLIWHIPDDLKRVKTLTMGCPLIMGRKTWDSIGRPLPGRASIVMTRDADWAADGAIRVATMTAAIAAARDWIEATAEARPEIILFGGGEIYAQGLDYCHRVERTVIKIAADGGKDAAFFPDLPADQWDIKIEAEIDAAGHVPAYRYEHAFRRVSAKPIV
ncbi:dihydrofolate reductase [Alphaproteobacteria bacterium]|nr:dihydrofolate reductase [Alphaproteobacteria bacterium]MDB2531188.1 dihydrofolate reductase [Alphaproteobacteria bacterium]MDB2638392.1 dihydrofolate reductase [Alphaproteobacteria bacterium]MDB3895790.1 dihydrofolate reductase [Alphaproteobacteria bacterium]MDC0492781.1 dihydrofolate reductase [Alphaproteobacteria bacterium]